MTKNFTGTIGSDTFEDPALFEAAAKEWRKPKSPARKAFGTAPTRTSSRSGRGWKAPTRKDFQERTGLEVGAEVSVSFTLVRGEERERVTGGGQVWSLAPAPGSVWVAAGDYFVEVDKRGAVLTVVDASGAFAGRASGKVAA